MKGVANLKAEISSIRTKQFPSKGDRKIFNHN